MTPSVIRKRSKNVALASKFRIKPVVIWDNQRITMKDIGGTIFNQDKVVDKHGYIHLDRWTGRTLYRLPLSIRERDEALMHVNSFSSVVNDPACDPRSGGIAGNEILARIYGVGVQQFRRNIRPSLHYLRKLADMPVTNVFSAENDAERYKAEKIKSWAKNLGINK